MMVGAGWISVVGITSWGKGVAGIGLFEFVEGADGTTVGVGLQAASRRISAEITIGLFIAYIYHDELQPGKGTYWEFYSLPSLPSRFHPGLRRSPLIEQLQPIEPLIEGISKLAIILPCGKIKDVVFHHLFHDPPGPGTGLPAIIQCKGI
jgi:hypothetical protein